jgi:hypothetical protein
MNRPYAWFSVLAVAATLNAQTAEQIVAESQVRSRAASQRYEGTLTTYAASGKTAEKRWTYSRLGSHGHSKALLVFTAPADVKGVALLVINHPDRASDQWMWTPAIQRERRIAHQDRSSRFFGTDFSFEDLEERDLNQYDHTLLGEEEVDGQRTWRIEARPKKSRSSQYTRSIVWIRKDNYTPVRIESYKGSQLARRLNYRDIEKIQNIWTPRTLEMSDLERKSRTVLRLEKLEYNVPMNEADFTVPALRRVT